MSFPRHPAYKDSGVEWLGEVPEHWEVGQSRRRFALRNERALDGEEQLTASQKLGIIRQADFVESEGRRVVEVIKGADILKHVEAGDFVISMRSFQGGIEYSPHCGSISSAYVMLKPIKDVHQGFFRWLFKSDRYIQALQSTSNLVRDGQALRFSNFAQVDVPVIPLAEQASIANFLDRETAKIDALIAEQQRLIELLQEKRQAVISHAVTKGLNPVAPMKDSGVEWLGEVPAHWEVTPLKYLSEIKAGFAFKSDDFTDSGVPVLRIGDIGKDGTVNFRDAKYLRPEVLADHSDVLVKQGDIVMAMTGATIGKAARYTAAEPALLNQRVCIFQARSPGSQTYVWFTLASQYYAEHLTMTAFGGAQPNISDSELVACKVAVPPVKERVEIAKRLSEDIKNLVVLENQSQHAICLLQERRSALISAAVTGQIDVRGLVPKASAP